MNEIRKNYENEEIIIKGTFKYSFGAVLAFIGSTLLSLLPTIISLAAVLPNIKEKQDLSFLIPICIFCLIWFCICFFGSFFKFLGIKRNELVITNKRIYGKFFIWVSSKKFSYRLDEIENVEMQSTFGMHHLALQFSQGKGPMMMGTNYNNGVATSGGFNVFRISNLANEKEIYDTLVDLLNGTKNVMDLETDIKMEGIKAENRKADALENLAKNAGAVISSSSNEKNNDISYIKELESLKKLLDDGVITKEEFEKEKKEILDNNHK